MTSGNPSQSPLMGSTSDQSRALSVASRAGVSLKTRDKCGLGQIRVATDGPGPGERQRRRGGELGSKPLCRHLDVGRDVAMNCQKAPLAAIAQNPGREGLHSITASMRLVHEGCGSGHFTVGGADIDLRKALAIARHGVTGSALEPYTGASRAGASLKTRDKCGLGQLRLATDGPGPGERERRRGGELRGWRVRV